MADFSFLSDSDDDKKVQDLLAQVMDDSVLEQVSAINCSGFSDSVLPTQLETRFSKLKSFPSAKPMSQIPPLQPLCPQFESELKKKETTQSDEFNVNVSNLSETPVVKKKKKSVKSNSQSGVSVSPSKMSDCSVESVGFSPSKVNKGRGLSKKVKSRNGSFRSPSNSKSSSRDSPSPTRTIGCFWCSPKKVLSKKSKEYKFDDDDLGKDEEFLSDLSDFSTKGQEKLLKKMMKEEEKINREAAKIVKWAKQASARMELSDSEDEPSDNESAK